jgi:hypothetical protein
MTLRRAVPQMLLALVAVLAAGCTSGGNSQPGAAGTTSAPAPSASVSTSAAPTPTPTPNLPIGCDEMLPFTDLDQALGRPLFGETRYVLGVAQPSIGRTGRVTCQYGLARGGRGPAPVEVGVSTYKDAESATQRVAATVAALRAGATSQTTGTVAGQPATVLGGRTGSTAVLAQGNRTVAVSVLRAVAGGKPDKAVLAIAEKVVANWGQ